MTTMRGHTAGSHRVPASSTRRFADESVTTPVDAGHVMPTQRAESAAWGEIEHAARGPDGDVRHQRARRSSSR